MKKPSQKNLLDRVDSNSELKLNEFEHSEGNSQIDQIEADNLKHLHMGSLSKTKSKRSSSNSNNEARKITKSKTILDLNSEHKDTDEIVEKMIHVGVCCMAKKLQSKPMQSIIKNLDSYNDFKITQFEEELILNSPIEDWPKVDVLISFYSSGFPMEKGLKYVNAYKPI